MKINLRKVTLLVLINILLLVGKVDAATLTQKLGDEYISTTIQAGKNVSMEFTSKIGFQFKRWEIEEGSVNITANSPSINFQMPSSNLTIRGVYDSEYIITFNSNGGEGSMNQARIAAGDREELPENTFTKTGYTFKGWATEVNGSVEYEDKASIKPTENMPLYAVWESSAVSIIPIEEIPVGAYIKYIPGSSTVTALGSDTGTGVDQTYNTGDYNKGWKVMYNNDGQLDIISAESVVDELIIGADTGGEILYDATLVDQMRVGYAKAPYVLNMISRAYATGEYAVSGRSLGSAGTNPAGDNLLECTIDGEQVTIDDVSYLRLRELYDNGKVTIDANYLVGYPYTSVVDMDAWNAELNHVVGATDAAGNPGVLLHTDAVNECVWLAYRFVGFYPDDSYFGVGCLAASGGRGSCDFGENSDRAYCISFPCGVRPIITLESGLKVVSGGGTSAEDPYVLSY